MGDSYGDPQNRQRNHEGYRDNSRGNFRGGRGPAGRSGSTREGGGFRIRLSDNEMRAARSLQEAFNLRSTVAVLGFAIRTLAQMLEDGKLDELVAQSKSEGGSAGQRRNDGRQGSKRNRFDGSMNNSDRGGSKPNPFARPEKPQPVTQENDLNSTEDEITQAETQADESSVSQSDNPSVNEDENDQPSSKNEEEPSQLSES